MKCVHCPRKTGEVGGVWGWPGKERLADNIHLQDPVYTEPFPLVEAGHLEREGGSRWIPLKAREGGPSAWGYPLDPVIARKPNVYVHLIKTYWMDIARGQVCWFVTMS